MGRMVLHGSRKAYAGILRMLSTVLALVLGVFCRKSDPQPQPVYGVAPEYGVQATEYRIEGEVKDAATTHGVPNILISLRDTGDVGAGPLDTARTDAGGSYSLSIHDSPGEHLWKVRAEDTDGATNGTYTGKDTTVGFGPNDTGSLVTREVDIPLNQHQQ